jgi:hypothetical protein
LHHTVQVFRQNGCSLEKNADHSHRSAGHP